MSAHSPASSSVSPVGDRRSGIQRDLVLNPSPPRSIKVVVMTSAYTASKYKSEAFKDFQVDDYLTKPVAFKFLRALLQRHLG